MIKIHSLFCAKFTRLLYRSVDLFEINMPLFLSGFVMRMPNLCGQNAYQSLKQYTSGLIDFQNKKKTQTTCERREEGLNINKQQSIKLNRISVPLKKSYVESDESLPGENEGNELLTKQTFFCYIFVCHFIIFWSAWS